MAIYVLYYIGLQQVPYNKLSSHIRTCKGLHSNVNGKHLEKLNIDSMSSNVMSLTMNNNGKLNQLIYYPQFHLMLLLLQVKMKHQ